MVLVCLGENNPLKWGIWGAVVMASAISWAMACWGLQVLLYSVLFTLLVVPYFLSQHPYWLILCWMWIGSEGELGGIFLLVSKQSSSNRDEIQFLVLVQCPSSSCLERPYTGN
jgi:hypothetical protein